MLLSLAALAALSIASAAPAASVQAAPTAEAGCRPLPGVEAVVARADLDYVILGEAHGTRELPEVFGDLVCALVADGRPVTVGLEFLPGEQAALDAYLDSSGDEAAVARLLASDGWADDQGRASAAILALVERLRTLKAGGADLAVAAFDHPSETPGTSAAREAGMARHLRQARAARPEAVVVALTGIGHAGRSAWTSFDPPFASMTQKLPEARTLTIAFVRSGGEAWGCRRPAEEAAPVCAAWPSPAREATPPRGLVMDASRIGFDAIISVGSAYSASPPARMARP